MIRPRRQEPHLRAAFRGCDRRWSGFASDHPAQAREVGSQVSETDLSLRRHCAREAGLGTFQCQSQGHRRIWRLWSPRPRSGSARSFRPRSPRNRIQRCLWSESHPAHNPKIPCLENGHAKPDHLQPTMTSVQRASALRYGFAPKQDGQCHSRSDVRSLPARPGRPRRQGYQLFQLAWDSLNAVRNMSVTLGEPRPCRNNGISNHRLEEN